MSGLHFDARIHSDQLRQDVNKVNRNINQISSNLQKEGTEIDAITSRIGAGLAGAGLAGAFSVFAAGNFIRDVARVRGEFQQLEVAFETMLGSKEKADQLMAEVVQFAATTPFELSEVASGSKQLLAFGVEAEKLIPTLKAMGDVSAGLSVPIERLITNFGQVRTQTKLTGRELRDFQMAGVPVVAELAKNMDVSEQAISDMVSAGKIGFAEVEQAFISMTSEGGRFSNLMEKQAKTITGLTSNLADAWDRMLNSIGQNNEGIIAGSIKGAITLVENYEEVIKILKLLVATYGAYKAATISVAVAQKAMAFGQNIRLIAMFRKELGLATAAQQAFNTASLANPYALALAAVASLISYLVIFRKETKTTQDYIEDLNNSIESIGRQVEVNTLIDKYDELTDKTELTKDEQNELNNTIAELGEIFPDTITGIDNYGKAIDIARDKIEDMNNDLRENAKELARSEVEEKQERINELLKKQAGLLEGVKTGRIYSEAYDELGFEGTEEQQRKQREELEKTTSEIQQLQASIGDLQGKIRDIDFIDAEKALQPYKNLFGEVEKYSAEQALKIKAELTKLLMLGFGSEAEQKIKAEIDKIASQLALPTIQEQIQQVVADLKTAQSQLDGLRAPGSRATPEQIGEKEDEIKALQEKYDALTGVTRKEAEKRQQEQQKAERERLKALTEFYQEEIDLERQLQASKIAIMKQGADRRKAEAELTYQQEIDRINQQQQAYLEAWNASQGFEPGDAGFITELPEAEIERFTQLRVNAEERKNQQIKEINRDTAKEVKAIWQDVNDVYRTEAEKDIQAINNRFDQLIERAKKAGETDFTSVNEARAKAIEESVIDSGMRRLQFEEEVEMQRAEISTQGFNRDIEIERKRLEIAKKFAQEKIDLLKKSGKEENENEIELLELFIKSADSGLEELNKRTLSESVAKVSEMVAGFKELTDTIFGTDTAMSNVLGGLSEMGGSLARIAAGDYSGALSFITSLQKTVMDTSNIDRRLSEPWEEFENWVAASNRQLQRYIDLRDDAIGTSRYDTSDAAIEQTIANIERAKQEMNELELSFTFETKGWFGAAQKEMEKLITDLQNNLGEALENEAYRVSSYFGYDTVKGIYSFDLSKLLYGEDGEFTIEKINDLIDEGILTDQKVIEAVEYYENLLDQLTAAEQQKQELLTATMADSIADSIIDGFSQGYNSAAYFAEGFEDLMKNAILNALKIQTLEEPLKEWYRQFAAYSESGDILTDDEIADLENSYNNIIDAAQKRFEEMKRISGLNFESDAVGQQGLTGGIKGITEETAGLIAGQFMAMREIGQKQYLTGIEQLDAINQSVTHLAAIAENTRHNTKLNSIDDRLAELNNYMKNAY